MTMKLIETKTLGSAVSSIDFTSIPQTYTDLLLLASIRTVRANISDDIVFRYNSDAGTNYSYLSLLGTGSAVSTTGGVLNRGYFGAVCGDSATSNTFGNGSLYIRNYTASIVKGSSHNTVNEQNSGPANQLIIAGTYSQTTAISSISLFSDNTANIMAGSTVSLYGILKGSDGIVTVS